MEVGVGSEDGTWEGKVFDGVLSTPWLGRSDGAVGEAGPSVEDIRTGTAGPAKLRSVVLAGVHSWGCSDLERVLPRPLLPVAGSPLIGHALAWLRQGGVSSVGVCANSDTPPLRCWLGAGKLLGLNVDYYEDVMPRGPAGCVRDAMLYDTAEHFLVVDGTIVPRLDLRALVESHMNSGAALTVVAEPVRGMRNGSTRLNPIGVYLCSRRVLQYIPERGYQDIKETLIPKLCAAGERVSTCVVEPGQAPRVNSLASYLAVSKWELTRRIKSDPCPADYVARGQAWIHRSARVSPGARLVGPILVEAGAVVEAGAIIVGPTAIGSDCRVAGGAVVSRSALWSSCLVSANAHVDHCVLVNGAVVGSGLSARGRVCLASSSRRGNKARARVSWSRGKLAVDDRQASDVAGSDNAMAPAASMPEDRLVGIPRPVGFMLNDPSRQLASVRVHTHGG